MNNPLIWQLVVRYCDLPTLNILRLVCKNAKRAIEETVYKVTDRTISNDLPGPRLQYMNGEHLWEWFRYEFDKMPAKIFHGNFIGHLTVKMSDVDPTSTFGVLLHSIHFALWHIEVL